MRTRSARLHFRPAVDKATRPCKDRPTAARLSSGGGRGDKVSTARSSPPDAASAPSEDGTAASNAPGGASLPDSGRRAGVRSHRVDLSDRPAAAGQRRRALAAARREYPARLPRKFGPSGAVTRHLDPPVLPPPARAASWGLPRFFGRVPWQAPGIRAARTPPPLARPVLKMPPAAGPWRGRAAPHAGCPRRLG